MSLQCYYDMQYIKKSLTRRWMQGVTFVFHEAALHETVGFYNFVYEK